MQVCLIIKIETASMLNNENRNCKFYFNEKVEIASLLNCGYRNCKHA